MRDNGCAAVRVSELPPSRVCLQPGEPLAVACLVCGRWRVVRRGMLWPHRAADGVSRCPGSGQRIAVDVSPGELAARLVAAAREAAARHARRRHGRVRQ